MVHLGLKYNKFCPFYSHHKTILQIPDIANTTGRLAVFNNYLIALSNIKEVFTLVFQYSIYFLINKKLQNER